jgi:poly(3-hydroxybutyrate) depolymerase
MGGASQAGAGGTSGAAGSSAGTGGAAVDAGVDGKTDGGTGPAGMSAGCGNVVADSPTAWVAHDIMVTVDAKFVGQFTQRRYWTRPPMNYDPNHAYPVTIWGQGCGQPNNPESTPMTQGPAAAGSIQVELLASQLQVNHCYSAGPDGDNANSPEIPYFDKVLADVEAEFCINKSKVFVGGYSSGGWFSSLMGCARANVIRGVAFISAGLQLNHPPCMGPVAAMIALGQGDPGTPTGQFTAARDDLRMRNGCGTTTKPWTVNGLSVDASCVAYDNCMPGYPLVVCTPPGGHTNGISNGISTQGFWALWSQAAP